MLRQRVDFSWDSFVKTIERVTNSRTPLQDFLEVSPVKHIATLQVKQRVQVTDTYFKDHSLYGYDIPQEIDRLWSEISINGRADIHVIYGYDARFIQDYQHPENRGRAKLLYYEVLDTNIEEVVTGFGVTNQETVQRVVHSVLNGLHEQLRQEFALNTWYIQQAVKNASCAFGNDCSDTFLP
jgi:hypothetical protein